MNGNKRGLFVYLAAFIALASAIYAIMTYGQTYVHGDSAISIRFLNAVKASGNLYPKSWNGVNGEIYTFNTLPISMVTLSLIKNKPLARALSSAISFALACLGLVWLSKKLFKNNSWIFMLPMFCVFISSDNARDMNLLQAAYCPQMVAMTFVVGLFLALWLKEIKDKRWWLLHAFLVFLMLTGGKRFIAEYLLPLFFVLAFDLLIKVVSEKGKFEYKEATCKYCSVALAVAIPSILGILLNKYINTTRNMSANGNSVFSIAFDPATLLNNIKLTIYNAISIFRYRAEGNLVFNAIAIIVALFVCVILPLLQLVRIKALNEAESQFALFAFLHNGIMLAAIILCSLTTERYLLSVVYVCIILSGEYLYELYFNHSEMVKIIVTVAICLTTFAYSYNLLKVTVGWKDKLDAQVSVCQQLKDRGVTKVYATYWPGYPVEIYSDNEITVAGISLEAYGLKKYYWHVDDNVFKKKDGKACLLLTEEEESRIYQASEGADPIERMIGKPYERFTMNGAILFNNDEDYYYSSNLAAYVFDSDDVADTLIDGLHDGVLVPREMDFNSLGNRTDDEIYLGQGGILHGPYDTIQAGHYTVKINGKNLNVCGTDVTSQQSQESISFKVLSETEDCKEIDLVISTTVEDIQFYLTNDTDETAEFYNITVAKK